jgi:hypothetical protein
MPSGTAVITCLECKRPWLDPAERWRAEDVHDPDGEDDPVEVAVYCPRCWAEEFDQDA